MTSRALRLVYREIPAMACRPGCRDCCGPVPWHAEEWARVADEPAARTARILQEDGTTVAVAAMGGRCAFLGPAGCTVYDRRPMVCRLFGTADEPLLRCPHGCRPKRLLTQAQATALTARYFGAARDA